MKETIYDKTWLAHLQTGDTLEEFTIGNYKAIALKVEQQVSLVKYHYRMLFFAEGGTEPVLALNLESTDFGTCCLGAHSADRHINYGSAELDMSYSDFKEWALEKVKEYLKLDRF